MDRIDLLRIYVRVAECRSFTKAASTLQIPRSSVSTAVRELEARLGARLLHRTTRCVTLTQDGSIFYERCVQLLADFEETELLFRQTPGRPQGRLRINVPGRIGRLIITPALPGFFALYPDIELEMGATDRAVDLVGEGIDCAIRVGSLQDSSLIARKIGDLELCNCASPAYLRAYGTPRTIDDLSSHLAVNYVSPISGRVEEWEYVEQGEVRTLPMRSRVTIDNAETYIACCLAGLGLIQVPVYDVRDHLAAGELVEILHAFRAAPMPIAIVYPHRRHLSRRLQVFIEWVTALLQAHGASG